MGRHRYQIIHIFDTMFCFEQVDTWYRRLRYHTILVHTQVLLTNRNRFAVERGFFWKLYYSEDNLNCRRFWLIFFVFLSGCVVIVNGKSSWRGRGWPGEKDEENQKRTKMKMNQTLSKVRMDLLNGGWQAHLETAIILTHFWSVMLD